MNQQPAARQCFVCGVENASGLHMCFYETDDTPAVVHAEYSVPKQYQGFPGVVHGGIIAAMLDEVSWRTILAGGQMRTAVTARMNIRYRKPVPLETPLHLTGRMVEDRGRVITVAGEIRGPDGALLAEAEATLVEVDEAYFGEAIKELDWQLVPDGKEER